MEEPLLPPFATTRLEIRQLQLQDASELAAISDTPAVSEWMAFMDGGFPVEKASALIASQSETNVDGTLVGAMG
jgi:hypothetical protein